MLKNRFFRICTLFFTALFSKVETREIKIKDQHVSYISYLDPNIPTIVRCFKARDGNGWQVSQQHTIAWRLAEYIVRRRRRLHTGGEAAARQ